MVKVPIVAMVIAAGMVLPAPARSQVSVNVSIGQPPPVIVAQPVLVPVQASPVGDMQRRLDKHLLPTLGTFLMTEITTDLIDGFWLQGRRWEPATVRSTASWPS